MRTPFPLPDLLAACCLIAALLTGCGPSIATVNGKPDHYYGKVLRFHGRVGDTLVRSETGDTVAFHLVSKNGHRVIVVSPRAMRHRPGTWVHVRGQFTAEREVAGRSFYDVVSAARLRRAGPLCRLGLF